MSERGGKNDRANATKNESDWVHKCTTAKLQTESRCSQSCKSITRITTLRSDSLNGCTKSSEKVPLESCLPSAQETEAARAVANSKCTRTECAQAGSIGRITQQDMECARCCIEEARTAASPDSTITPGGIGQHRGQVGGIWCLFHPVRYALSTFPPDG